MKAISWERLDSSYQPLGHEDSHRSSHAEREVEKLFQIAVDENDGSHGRPRANGKLNNTSTKSLGQTPGSTPATTADDE